MEVLDKETPDGGRDDYNKAIQTMRFRLHALVATADLLRRLDLWPLEDITKKRWLSHKPTKKHDRWEKCGAEA
jgi:hypothetical protein